MISRRRMLATTAAALAAASTRLAFAQEDPHAGHGETGEELPPPSRPTQSSTRRMGGHARVVTPNGTTLPWKRDGKVKVFHLIAEPVKRRVRPRADGELLGLQRPDPGSDDRGRGGRSRADLRDQSPAGADDRPLARHPATQWMDGVSGLNQQPIQPGETFKYEFTLRQHGTHMYHPHFDEMVQMAMGMRACSSSTTRSQPAPGGPRLRDHAQRVVHRAGHARHPNPTEMTDFNMLTFNSKVFPGTEPLVARTAIGYASASATSAAWTATRSISTAINSRSRGPTAAVARSGPAARDHVWVPVGSTRDVEFVADEPGDWALHCHITHHVMNQMGHELFPNLLGARTGDVEGRLAQVVPGTMLMGQTGMGDMMEMGAPRNSIPMMGGVGPFSRIDMGGMFTILKVRKDLTSYEDPGWFRHPDGTVAQSVTEEELRKAGFDVPAPPEGPPARHQGHHGHGGSR